MVSKRGLLVDPVRLAGCTAHGDWQLARSLTGWTRVCICAALGLEETVTRNLARARSRGSYTARL